MRRSPSTSEDGMPQSNAGCLVLVAVVACVILLLFQMGLHSIAEGHVGMYYRGGALLDRIEQPGYHWKIPFLDTVYNVQVTMQTDSVTSIPCGTSGGVLLEFERVEVVNRLRPDKALLTVRQFGIDYDQPLIFQKVHHEMNQFCSSHSVAEVYISKFDQLDDMIKDALQADCDKFDSGVDIIAVRVTKPRIPDVIRKNYELMEAEKTKLLIAAEHQKVVEKEAETERKRACIDAEKQAEVSRINMEREVAEKRALQEMESIENTIALSRARARTDAEHYRALRDAEANRLRLTPEYLRLQLALSLANNTKIFFGENIPKLFFDPQLLFSSTTSSQSISDEDREKMLQESLLNFSRVSKKGDSTQSAESSSAEKKVTFEE